MSYPREPVEGLSLTASPALHSVLSHSELATEPAGLFALPAADLIGKDCRAVSGCGASCIPGALPQSKPQFAGCVDFFNRKTNVEKNRREIPAMETGRRLAAGSVWGIYLFVCLIQKQLC